MNITEVERVVDGMRPAFRAMSARVTRAISRNPGGWELWLALQADAAAERKPAS